jgi:hypothetical protein
MTVPAAPATGFPSDDEFSARISEAFRSVKNERPIRTKVGGVDKKRNAVDRFLKRP